MVVGNQQTDHVLLPRWVQHTRAVEKTSYALMAAANTIQHLLFCSVRGALPLTQLPV